MCDSTRFALDSWEWLEEAVNILTFNNQAATNIAFSCDFGSHPFRIFIYGFKGIHRATVFFVCLFLQESDS